MCFVSLLVMRFVVLSELMVVLVRDGVWWRCGGICFDGLFGFLTLLLWLLVRLGLMSSLVVVGVFADAVVVEVVLTLPLALFMFCTWYCR